jgi:hypothetical protein
MGRGPSQGLPGTLSGQGAVSANKTATWPVRLPSTFRRKENKKDRNKNDTHCDASFPGQTHQLFPPQAILGAGEDMHRGPRSSSENDSRYDR